MTVVLKLAWTVFASLMLMLPVAIRLPLVRAVSSVTAATVGAPITAASSGVTASTLLSIVALSGIVFGLPASAALFI